MKTKILTKEQAVTMLADRLDCAPDALAFLFNFDNIQRNYNETLIIPDQRILN